MNVDSTKLPSGDLQLALNVADASRKLQETLGKGSVVIPFNAWDAIRAAALRSIEQSFGEMRCACEFPCLSAENKSHDDGCPLYPHDRITESDIVRTIQGDDIDAKNELLRRLGRARLEASFQASDDAPELIEKWRPVVQRAFAIAVQDTNSEFVPSLSAQRVAQYILDGTKP